LPSAVRGTGPFMSGSPLAVLGTPGVAYFGHWADNVAADIAIAVISAAERTACRILPSVR
jgi:hypothetical protein